MTYEIEISAYGQDDRQPAEQFEDELERSATKLLASCRTSRLRVAQEQSRSIGGGLWEKCCDCPDLWEVRTIFAKQLARYIAAVYGQHDPPRMVLLAGVAKQTGEPIPQADSDERLSTGLTIRRRDGSVHPRRAQNEPL